jgi:hypothetical protein
LSQLFRVVAAIGGPVVTRRRADGARVHLLLFRIARRTDLLPPRRADNWSIVPDEAACSEIARID